MQFLILAYDGMDREALARRMAARNGHIAHIDNSRANMIAGAALLDGQGQMNGSAMMVDFPSREALDAWLKEEPYVTGKVWERVQVIPCRLGPSFSNLLAKTGT